MNEINHLVANYKPSEAAIALVAKTKIALLVGISGAGKDTIKKELLAGSQFSDIVSHTTRSPRVNNGIVEISDVDYHFIDNQTARIMLENKEFIEAKFVHGTVYGTSITELEKAFEANRIALTDIDVQGVVEYKNLSQAVIAMFIIPPSYGVWKERLQRRYDSQAAFTAEWRKRRESAITELTHALEVPYYHFIINDELGHSVEVASEIAHHTDTFSRMDDVARLRARDLLHDIQNDDHLAL